MQFEELAEIYASMSLRSFGFSVIGIFVPVYLYTEGVTLRGIFLFFTLFFIIRIPLAICAAFVVGRIGPKHTIAVSTIVIIMFLLMLLSYNLVGWPLLLLAAGYSAANALFFTAYHTDFSKIKHKSHGGKELGWLLIFEQSGRSLGPIVGGLLGGLFAPEFTLMFAIAVLLGSLVPLFLTNEPVKIHQNIKYSGFKVKEHIRDYRAFGGLNVSHFAIVVIWPLFVAVTIFNTNTYEKLGILIGVSMAVSIFSAHMFGRFIDSQRGLYLLRYGVVMNVVLLLSKSLITGVGGAVAASTLGQPIFLAYRMPLSKAMYDRADDIEGYRIVYISLMEVASAFIKALYCGSLLIATYFFDPILVLRLGFVAAALIGLLMLTQKFPALKKV